MKKTSQIALGLFGVVIATAAVIGWVSKAQAAKPPVCPAIWAPVICDNGKIYPNQCEADKRNAKNCVPYDGL